MKALPNKSWNHGLSWCAFAVSMLAMFACLCGAAFHLARAYIRTAVSTFPDEWPSFWAALFSLSFSVFSLVVCYKEVKSLGKKTIVISLWKRVALFVFIIAIFLMTFLSLVAYIVIEDIQTTLWVLMGFTPTTVLMVLEIDILKRSYKVEKSPKYSEYILTSSDSSWGKIPAGPYPNYEEITNAKDPYAQLPSSLSPPPRALSPTTASSSPYGLRSTNRFSSLFEGKTFLKVAGYVLGALVMAFIVVTYLLFTITSLVHASSYGIMRNPPGKRYQVPFSNTSERMINLHINCIGNHSAKYPYTLIFEHDQSIPSPSMFLVQSYITNILKSDNENANNNNNDTMRICTYDRGGYGWSERGRNIVLESEKAQQLIALLGAAGEAGPYVFGAHGHGGLVMAETISQLSLDSVAGIVLIDSYVFGNIRKRIDKVLKESYERDVRRIIGAADRHRAVSPIGGSWIKASKKAAAVNKFVSPNLRIGSNPEILAKDAIEWSMRISSGLDSAYWDILEYYKKDAVSNEVIRKLFRII